MTHVMVLPELGETIEEAEVQEWMVGIDDEVEDGEPILIMQTDKAALEINATASGRLSKMIVSIGQFVKVGEPVAEIE
mgnify:FL=1